MPVIQVNDKQHSLKPGQTRVGAGPGVDVAVSDDPALGLQAILELGGNNSVVIRPANESAVIRVNGVPLADPTPLMHGDKVEIGGREILFSDDKKVGATQFVSASDVAAIAAKRSGPARATAATGGRLVSLVDGKEYQIPGEGITFGREAGSDVVVAQAEVSRRHATIAPSEGGYSLTDHSTNGVWVNGNRVQGSQVLARADVVRVGSEEFRFYADVAPVAKPTPATASPAAPPAAAAAPPVASPPALPTPPTPPTPPAAPPIIAAAAPPPAPPPAAPPPPAAERPFAAPPAPRSEPPTAPAPVRTAPAARPPKKEASTAVKDAPKGGIPSWLWILLLLIVAAAAYYLGMQGRG